VVVQELPVLELIEHILGITGKDEPRVREVLLRGTVVSGASRFRWAGLEADLSCVRDALAHFPDPDPSRPFAPERCVRAILRGGRQAIGIAREAVGGKTLFRRETFWDKLMAVIAKAPPVYSGYSYRERADRYTREFTAAETEALRAASPMVRYSTLRDQIHSSGFSHAELLTLR
jgi:hypothetical protein